MTEETDSINPNIKFGNIETGDMVSSSTVLKAYRIVREQGRAKELFNHMTHVGQCNFIGENTIFDGVRDAPEKLAKRLVELSDEIRAKIAEQKMQWFDFGRLTEVNRSFRNPKGFQPYDVLELVSDNQEIGKRVLYCYPVLEKSHPINVPHFRNRRKKDVLLNTKVAVFGNDTFFLDYRAFTDDLDLTTLAPVTTVDEVSRETEAVGDLARMFQQAEEKEKQTKNEIAGLRASLDEAQAFSIMAYEDQLAGLKREINEEWKANVDRLGDEGDLEGKTFTVYFKGRHPFESLAKRYRENLGGAAHWKVICKRHEVGNIYSCVKENEPENEYLIALGKDDTNHVFAFSFFSKVGKKWIDEEMKYVKATDTRLSAYDLFQVYDKVSAVFEAKKKARG